MTQAASRREFLRRAGALTMMGSAAPLALNLAALGSASAQSASDYKAIVCLFMYGGNDSYNMVLPTDAGSWSNYTTTRNQAPDSIALRSVGTSSNAGAAAGSPDRLGGVLALNPIDAQGRGFAVHPLLGGVRDLFNSGRLAIVPNVGPLKRPTTKADCRTAGFPLPASLYSHNDQQSTWQTLAAEGATTGWGGRMGDLMASSNSNAAFTTISSSGNAVWLSGRQVLQYQVATTGAIAIGRDNLLYGSRGAFERARNILRSARSSDLMAQDHAGIVGRSMDTERLVSAALPAANTAPFGTPGLGADQPDPLLQYTSPLTGARTSYSLTQQLQIVARMIATRGALGARRQVFFVSLDGFDTHNNQNQLHSDLMARLSNALVYFDRTLTQLGVQDDVTTFTASDFGRTFTSNGDGTDHGWGSHQFVMGGAVRGRNLYGRFPQYGVSDGRRDFTSPDQLGNGVMLPTTSVDQLGATLGRWFGLSDGQLLDVFPNLSRFDATARNLGFMG